MGQSTSRGDGLSSGVRPRMDSSDSGRRGSRVELRRSSIFSTLDLVPHLDHYASTAPPRGRPSLVALHNPFSGLEAGEEAAANTGADGPQGGAPGAAGWMTGVMFRCMLNMWGVVLLLRLSWITSQAGLLLTWLIVLMSMTLTSVTALSISAIATNGRAPSGGLYVLMSRSLGPEVGGPVGVLFFFANTLACALSTVGFAEVVSDLMQESGAGVVDSVNDIRIVGVVTVTVLLLMSLAGMKWRSQTHVVFFMFVYAVSFVNFFVGTFLPAGADKQAKGIFGYRRDVFISNLMPMWRGAGGTFLQMFALFFPSTIGVLSGVNGCGELKDPAAAVPKGTMMGVLWTTLSFLAVSATVGSCVVRDASGNVAHALTGNISAGCVDLGCRLGWNFTACVESQSCDFGLANSLKVPGQLAGFYYLNTAGVFVATLSSALGFLATAPEIFQCLCRDNLYPYIGFFAKGYGKNDEPVRASVLCYVIAVAFVLVAELNTLAALVTNVFLCCYCLINFGCFHASFTNSPGWRPSVQHYRKWAALLGAVVSVVLMFLFTWWAALVTCCVTFLLFGYVNYNKPEVGEGSSEPAGTYNMSLSYSVSLSGVDDHVKNFRPQCLVLTGPPNRRPALVDFVNTFTKNTSLMICGDIVTAQQRQTRPQGATQWSVRWLNQRKVRSFYAPVSADGLRAGARHLLQASGLGKLKPNTLVLGFQSNWRDGSPETTEDYVNTIRDTLDSSYCVCVLRMMDGLNVFDQFEVGVNQGFDPEDTVGTKDLQPPGGQSGDGAQLKTAFQSDQGNKTIDVYWLADDGGLTLLVPYLLTRRKRWRLCRVRVFVLGDEGTEEAGRSAMMSLLRRFRLDFDDVVVMTDSENPPLAKNLRWFEDSVAPFRLRDEQQDVSAQESEQRAPGKISDEELEAFKLKSQRNVRLNEIVRRNSQHAALVLMSLPVPQRDCPTALYMAWLDTLTRGLHCPAVLTRGNQQDVLTFSCL